MVVAVTTETQTINITSDTALNSVLLARHNGNYCKGYAIQQVISIVSPVTGCFVKVQGSLDNTNWVDITDPILDPIPITAAVNILIEQADPMFDYVRTYFTISTGEIAVTQITSSKVL